jgi:hypothetical protein
VIFFADEAVESRLDIFQNVVNFPGPVILRMQMILVRERGPAVREKQRQRKKIKTCGKKG